MRPCHMFIRSGKSHVQATKQECFDLRADIVNSWRFVAIKSSQAYFVFDSGVQFSALHILTNGKLQLIRIPISRCIARNAK